MTQADEPQIILTANGQRFEKACVTELTPAMITIVHSAGVARMPLWELAPEFQTKFGYDEAKARAWLAEQARAAEGRASIDQAKRAQTHRESVEAQRQIEAITDYIRAHPHATIDPHTGRLYDPDVEAVQREMILKDIMRQRAARSDNHPH